MRFLNKDDAKQAIHVIDEAYNSAQDVVNSFERDYKFASIKNFQQMVFVGKEINGKIVAVSAFSPAFISDRIWELCWGTVIPKYQGQGIGKEMLDFRLKEIEKKVDISPSIVLIHTRPTRLYLEAGFEKIDQFSGEKWIMKRRIK